MRPVITDLTTYYTPPYYRGFELPPTTMFREENTFIFYFIYFCVSKEYKPIKM